MSPNPKLERLVTPTRFSLWSQGRPSLTLQEALQEYMPDLLEDPPFSPRAIVLKSIQPATIRLAPRARTKRH